DLRDFEFRRNLHTDPLQLAILLKCPDPVAQIVVCQGLLLLTCYIAWRHGAANLVADSEPTAACSFQADCQTLRFTNHTKALARRDFRAAKTPARTTTPPRRHLSTQESAKFNQRTLPQCQTLRAFPAILISNSVV